MQTFSSIPKMPSLQAMASFLLAAIFTINTHAGDIYTNSIGMEFVRIPAGSFKMGTYCKDDPFTAQDDCKDIPKDEMPQHRVTISNDFFLGKTEVTQRQWYEIMGDNPAKFQSDVVGERSENHPVEHVSWDDVQRFISRLNDRENCNTCYRLPTEAEWEYAARAGSDGEYSYGNGSGRLGEYAWYSSNSDEKTHAVAQKKPNAWGLYDMHGNVWEWVQDWYSDNYYANSPSTDPKGLDSGKYRSLRGGSWYRYPNHCRAAARDGNTPGNRSNNYGFRVVRLPR